MGKRAIIEILLITAGAVLIGSGTADNSVGATITGAVFVYWGAYSQGMRHGKRRGGGL